MPGYWLVSFRHASLFRALEILCLRNYSWFTNFAESFSANSFKTTETLQGGPSAPRSLQNLATQHSVIPMRLWHLIVKIFAKNHSTKKTIKFISAISDIAEWPHPLLTYLGSQVRVNLFHAWYANYGIQSALVYFWLLQYPSEPWGNQLDTMVQFLPVRGAGAKFFWGELGHHRRQRLMTQTRSWTFILNGLNRLSPKCNF